MLFKFIYMSSNVQFTKNGEGKTSDLLFTALYVMLLRNFAIGSY